MNRSNIQSSRSQSSFKHNNNNLCKSKSSTKSKSSNGYQFQTIWKYRNSHRTQSTSNHLEKQNSSVVVRLQQQQQGNLHQGKAQVESGNLNRVYETAAHQEMKQFVKMMKKNSSNFQNCQQKKNINIQVSHINNLQSQQSRNLLTNRTGTARSTKSQQKQLYQSRFLDQPRNQKTNRTNNTKNTIQQSTLTLNQLQKKIQDIIKAKLEKQYNQSRISPNNNKLYQQDELDKKLKKLIEEVRSYSSPNQDNRLSRDKQKFQQNIKDIGQKISIIEKAIALSSTQNQILKDRYSSTKKARKHFATTSSSKKYQTPKPSIQQFLISKPSPPLHYQTTNLSTFVQPTYLAYQNQLQINQSLRKSQFIMNRQPMPRSLYQREYLYYGVLPTYSNGHRADWNKNNKNKDKIKQKQNCSLINLGGKQTTYQCQFKQKVASLVDSKDLDCRRDKFKNVGINFIPCKMNQNNPNSLKKTKNKNSQIQPHQQQYETHNIYSTNISTISNKQNQIFPININTCTNTQNKQNIPHKINQTQQQSQFKGSKNIISSVIKQKNLNNLKYTYKFFYQT